MGEIDYIRERESGAAQGAGAGRKAAEETTQPAARKWPLWISLLIAVVVSVILWAGIIVFAMRLWRWI